MPRTCRESGRRDLRRRAGDRRRVRRRLAALRAAEFVGNVVLVDKARVSRGGASTMSGGVTTCPTDDDDLDAWAAEFIVCGGYMCDQDWTRKQS